MSKEDRVFYKRLKKVQKEYKPLKCFARKPYNWKKEWGPFVKYDSDWDYSSLLNVILYKLEKMYLALDVYSYEVREDLDPKLKTLREIIDLGKKIQTYDYEQPSYDWLKEHSTHIVLIYNAGQCNKEEPIHTIRMGKKTDSEDPLEDFFCDKQITEWCKENHIDRKAVDVAYTGEWDSKENQKIWKKKCLECSKEKLKDSHLFFKLIADNYQAWWF